MSGLPNRLNMVHSVGGGANLTLTWPQKPFRVGHKLIGGGEKSASRVPSNYVITEEPRISLEVRVLEGSEQAAFVTFLKTIDAAAAAATLKMDADVSTTIVAYLESPSVRNGDIIEPSGRDDRYPSVLLYQVVFCPTTATVLSPQYFP